MVTLLHDKPHLGMLLSAAGAVSGLLTWLQIITTILGFAGALFGAIAGFITLLIKWREYRKAH